MQIVAGIRIRELQTRLRARPWLLAIVGACALALVGAIVHAVDRGPDLDQFPTARVQRGDVRIGIVESGELRSEQQSTVSAITDKQIIWLVPEGTHVKEGDLLLRFESQKYEIAKSTAESALAVARADLARTLGQLEAQRAAEEKARLEYASLPELAEKGYVNRNELDAARLGHQEVQAATRSFEASVDAARANVERAEHEVQQWDRKLSEGFVRARG